MSNDHKEQRKKLLTLVKSSLSQDIEFREKYKIGDKFRFVRDRLTALVDRVEENLKALEVESEKVVNHMAEDEVIVYVYLYNAQGLDFNTWNKMLNPSVFYEYSVNRPIYTEKADIEAFIRSRAQKNQHGFLSVIIKKESILGVGAPEAIKDAIGGVLIRVKEGSLSFKRLQTFTHNGVEYEVLDNGEIRKKLPS
jgi:hypothetical protein